jgi:hypothetical protein
MNNQGMIHIAERQALKDIATYQSQLVDMSFINKKFVVTASYMCVILGKKIRKQNKLLRKIKQNETIKTRKPKRID